MSEKDETTYEAYRRMIKENHDCMMKHARQQAEFDIEMLLRQVTTQLEIQNMWNKALRDSSEEKITVAM